MCLTQPTLEVFPLSSSLPRLFVAVPLDESSRKTLADQCSQWKAKLPFQKWIHPADYHITLKFLGETAVDTIAKLKQPLQALAQSTNAFTLQLKGLGVFGSAAAPSILWSGITGDLSQLAQLQSHVEKALQAFGFPLENRSFHPHLTLARRYQGKEKFDRALLEPWVPLMAVLDHWNVDKLVIYESHLNRQPLYEPLHVFSLHAPPTQTKNPLEASQWAP
jgi:2'-5' RNA ligase